MLATGFRKIRTFPDHHFQQIVTGMRTLRPPGDSLVTAAAANNRAGMRQIDETVVQLGEDCGVKLRTTVKKPSTGLAPLGQNGVFYDQIMLSDQLLPTNAPDQWGPTTTVPNRGPIPQKVPPACPLRRKTYLLIIGITSRRRKVYRRKAYRGKAYRCKAYRRKAYRRKAYRRKAYRRKECNGVLALDVSPRPTTTGRS